MPIPAILVGLGTILAGIWAGVKTVSEATFNIARVIFDTLWNFFIAFYSTSPKIVKILLWLFFVLFLGNVIVGTIMHLNFYCTSTNDLMIPKSFFDSVKMFFTTAFTNIENNNLTYDEYIAHNTIFAQQYSSKQAEGIFFPKCIEGNPRLMLFGVIDFLSYKFWIIVLIIGFIIGLMSKDYV